MPIVGLSPYLCHAAASSGSDPSLLLYTWAGGSVLALSFYGGVFSVLPAYIADLFGQKHAGAIHGNALTAWAASAVAGPMGMAMMRQRAVDSATLDLVRAVDDEEAFVQAFGCTLNEGERIQTLIDAKTITISRLMEVVPPCTVDPTPFLYDHTCYVAAGLMGVALLANLAINPLSVNATIKQDHARKSTASVDDSIKVQQQLELQLQAVLP